MNLISFFHDLNDDPRGIVEGYTGFKRDWGEFVMDTHGELPSQAAYERTRQDLERILGQRGLVYRMIHAGVDFLKTATHTGVFWTLDKRVAEKWHVTSGYDERFKPMDRSHGYLLCAKPTEIDWDATVAANYASPSEEEIRFFPDKPIEIVSVNGKPISMRKLT